ncbi:MAG TPA: hypothetical protein VMQ86_01425 [Bryobacteraceae bacterium]|nr:hypothetical protein [Bryobacteraceae bacterium]
MWLIVIVAAAGLPLSSLAQHKQFIQAELLKTVKAKSAKPGDPVRARAVNAVSLPGGVAISEGATLLGEVRAADLNSLSISFEQLEVSGKKTPLALSIRAAMMPGGPQNNVDGVAAQTGAVIGLPGVTLKVDDSPQHASKFESSGKELQLKQGLQFMLAVPQ